MNKVKLEQGTPEWVAYRQNGIGGSDIASIIGAEGAFKKRGEVMQEKLGHAKELTEYQKAIFSEGHEWEAVVRSKLNEQGFNFVPAVATSPINERYFASFDGIDEGRRMVLEVKSVQSMERFKAYCENTPAHYMAQVQWQLFVSGYNTASLAFVCQGELMVKEITADTELQSRMVVEAVQFLADLDATRAGTLPGIVTQLESSDAERLIQLKLASVEVGKRLAELDDEVKALAEKILKDNNAVAVQSPNLSIQWVEREGSVDYKKIPELAKIDLNQYRKKGTKFLKITIKQ